MTDRHRLEIRDGDTVVHIPRNIHEENEVIACEDWEPGEPLYATASGGYTRQLFQVLPDSGTNGWWGMYWCHFCDVIWATHNYDTGVNESARCWSCGKFTRHPDDPLENQVRSEMLREGLVE